VEHYLKEKRKSETDLPDELYDRLKREQEAKAEREAKAAK